MNQSDVICIYGLDHQFYAEFQAWLKEKKERFLVFVEDEESAFTALIGSPLLNDPQVKTFFLKRENEDEVFKQISWDFVFLKFSYLPHPNKSVERGREIFAKMAFYQSGVELLVADYSDFGVKILQNFRKNSMQLPKASRMEALKNSFSGIPAIICGGGPSLSKNIEKLGHLSDKALIFAGGSSLKVLAHHKITPHFGASLDPDPPYQRFLEQSAFEVPFFYKDRVSPELLFLAHGPRLWVPDSGGYPLERWFVEELGISEKPFDVGWNVGNLCIAVAACLGCNPIILVGMDLSASKERMYAPGVEEKIEKEKLILVHDTQGNPFYSRRDWMMAAQWIESFAEQHKGTNFINATEGGVGFKNIPARLLSDVAEEHLLRAFDLQGMIHGLLQEIETMKVTSGQVHKQWEMIDQSYEICRQRVDRMFAIMEEVYPNSPLGKGEFVLNEFELEEELIAVKLLQPLWGIWKYVFRRRMPEAFDSEMGELINKLLFYKKVLDHGKV